MVCEWCESITDNEMELVTNGYGKQVWVSYCDRCKKACEEMGDKGEGESHAERLSETDHFVGVNEMVCDSLNNANIERR